MSDVPRTVDNLRAYYLQLSLEDRAQFFELLWAALYSEPLVSRKAPPSAPISPNVHGVVIQACAAFGNTAELGPRIFGLLSWNDPQNTEAWAERVSPQFEHSLVHNADRFARPTLDAIKGHAGMFTYERDSGLTGQNFPESLVQAAARITSDVERIEFERFEKTLRETVGTQQTDSGDLNALLASLGLNLRIAEAMEEVRSHLQSPGSFSAKIAGDLLRSSMDTTHRELVKALAKLKQTPYSGKEEDRDRRAYMREVGFISLSEEKFFSAIYSLISEEASHKLDAPRETVLVMQQTVQAYLLLLLRRLSDWSEGQSIGWAGQ